MKARIRTFKEKKNKGAGEKQDQSFLSLSKMVVTKSFILRKNTRDDMWGLVLAYV